MPATAHRLGESDPPVEARVEVAVALLEKAAEELRRLLEEIKEQNDGAAKKGSKHDRPGT